MQTNERSGALKPFESRVQLRFACGSVNYAVMPPHEVEGYNSFSHPFSIGVSFTGHLDAVIETAAGRLSKHTLAPGTWATTGAGAVKWLRVLEPAESVMIYPAPSEFSQAPEEAQIAWQRHSGDMLRNRFDPSIWAVCARFRRVALGALVISDLEAESLIGNLLIHVAVRHLGARPPQRIRGRLDAVRLARVTALIESRLPNPPTLRELATTAAMSPFHFQRMFCTTTGMSPHAYVTARRMDRARRMLSETGMTVAEVGRILGFSQPSHLRRAFRRQFNASPRNLERSLDGRESKLSNF